MTGTVEELADGLFELRAIDRASKRIALLHRAAGLQRSSAEFLRRSGKTAAARRAETAASRIRLTLDEPKAAGGVFASARTVRETSDHRLALERALPGAMSLLGADLGNVQLRDSRTGALRIVADSGFSAEFLEYFANVADDSCACRRAAVHGKQIVIVDVDRDETFRPHREIAAASRFRAVQSTPVFDGSECLVGVVSTHFRQPLRPPTRDLLLLDWYVERISDTVARGDGC